MDELAALHALADALGVQTQYRDGLGKQVVVTPETLVRVCAALGAEIVHPAEAAQALWLHCERVATEVLPPVVVAWDGQMPTVPIRSIGPAYAWLKLEQGGEADVELRDGALHVDDPLELGYHRLTVELEGRREQCTVIAAPTEAYQRPGRATSWGVGVQLAALRSRRSRSVGDLADLETLCRWIGGHGGDLVTVLPLLPTFNGEPAEPSPYSPVSRLYWSELMLDLGDGHHPTDPPSRLDVTVADREVRAALADREADAEMADDEALRHYARFRGAQAKLGRNWRDWPSPARGGAPTDEQVDADEERFHLAAQSLARRQLQNLRQRLDHDGFRLGLDLAVGVHPDGYDTWSRPSLFVAGMSVGAPPDGGFPSGQDWGFAPVHPEASRREGHAYIASSIGHQMALAGVLRVDHIMAWTRLYWIPHGLRLDQGTYVSYPADELFAILTLESHRHRCEVVGENLGTVPLDIFEALPRHRIWGMYLAQFESTSPLEMKPPTEADVALIGTHDTPTFAGWLAGEDIDDRLRQGMIAPAQEEAVRAARDVATARLAVLLGTTTDDPRAMLTALLEWLGRSESPLVVPWLEDLWLEARGVNLPGTRSSECPNWQRPMGRLLDDFMHDPAVQSLLRHLQQARHAAPEQIHG